MDNQTPTPIVPTIETPQEVKVEEIPAEKLPSQESPVEEAQVIEEKKEEVPETPTSQPEETTETKTPAPKAPVEIDGKDTVTIRSNETGDKVYALRDDKRYWVRNPESLAKMGFYLGQEKTIPFSELLNYPEGEPIDMTVPAAEYPWNKPEVPKSEEPSEPFKVWQ
jgi:hypothetical protein